MDSLYEKVLSAQIPESYSISASDSLLYSSDTEVGVASSNSTLVKSATVRLSGVYRVSFALRPETSNKTAYARIYRDSEAVGTARSYTGSTVAVTYTEDITFIAGQNINIVGYSSTNTSESRVSNFRIYGTIGFATEYYNFTPYTNDESGY